MRIVCPNCDAQYEIPNDVMPLEGRDVQCSNCDKTWFQNHPDAEPTDEDDPDAKPAVRKSAPPRPSKPVVSFDAETGPKPAAAQDAPVRKPLDPDVAEVLREEAAIETKARRNQQSEPLESQPDLGLETFDTDHRSEASDERGARLPAGSPMSEDLAAPAMAEGILAPRRDRLPNIEEINSTLRPNSSRSPDSDPGQTAQIEQHEARSSRLGFSLVVALFAVLVLAYVFAGALADALPQLETMLTGYVAIVNTWRTWLDEKTAALVTWLEAAAASSTP